MCYFQMENESKKRFIIALRQLEECKLHPSSETEQAIRRTKEFLGRTFDIGREDITFTAEEPTIIVTTLAKVLPMIGYYIGHLVTWFEPALAVRALIARSAIQFLYDKEFLSEDQFSRFKETENVDGLEECLENWKYGPIGPFDPSFYRNSEMIAGVPESHHWWPEEIWETEDDRSSLPLPHSFEISSVIKKESESVSFSAHE